MKKIFFVALSLCLFVTVFCYANDDTDFFGMKDPAEIYQEMDDTIADLLQSVSELYKDASPEEKAIYRKSMEDQMNSTLALMDLKYKEYAKDATNEEKKAFDAAWKQQKQLIEQSYKKTMEAMGL